MIISLIAAMANNRVIGINGEMPWHLPADFAWFKKNTLNKPIIMGKSTYQSIGHPLPQRKNIIISRTEQLPENENMRWVKSIGEALELVKAKPEVMIIGGGQIYQQLLPLADRLYLTHIEADLAGDTFFPNYTQFSWSSVYSQQHEADTKNSYAYRFEILNRKPS